MHMLLEWFKAKCGAGPATSQVLLSCHWLIVHDTSRTVVHTEPFRPRHYERFRRRLTRRYPAPHYSISALITCQPVASPRRDLEMSAVFDHFSDRLWEALADTRSSQSDPHCGSAQQVRGQCESK